jgi:alkanesulfonate monooxygenase SsuD/methylene tetrahydromethanopterin reductase-like flavin-dependent oxidoreductase (luciferase family)
VARRGIFVAPFDELAEARVLADLAARAEAAGWDGFFLWDHVDYRDPVTALADPWVCMAAIACTTERMRIGPLVTPPARRRIHKLARETVTLDRLSGGRLIFGAGLGSDNSGEFSKFGEEADAKERARLLDEGLEQLVAFWDGEFQPRPAQKPRIPVWLAASWPS